MKKEKEINIREIEETDWEDLMALRSSEVNSVSLRDAFDAYEESKEEDYYLNEGRP